MTFAEYWKKNEPFGCDPEEVANLAWDAAIRASAEIAKKCIGCRPREIADKIRDQIQMETKGDNQN